MTHADTALTPLAQLPDESRALSPAGLARREALLVRCNTRLRRRAARRVAVPPLVLAIVAAGVWLAQSRTPSRSMPLTDTPPFVEASPSRAPLPSPAPRARQVLVSYIASSPPSRFTQPLTQSRVETIDDTRLLALLDEQGLSAGIARTPAGAIIEFHAPAARAAH